LAEQTHNLLTLSSDAIYYNTNLGAVAALRPDDGRVLWLSLYPRASRGDLAKPAAHWRRDLNPCVLDRGTLLVAPADSPRIFAFDAATGQLVWQTGTEVEDAVGLLGTSGDWLVAGGSRLYWISLKDEDRGRVKHVWPDGPQRPGYGRGILAGHDVLWPTRDKLYIFDQQTARRLRRQSADRPWQATDRNGKRVDRFGNDRRTIGRREGIAPCKLTIRD
jgi:outer membrane protein assembly factor BamB